MKLIQSILSKAKTSAFYLWILNHLLWRLIPFNHSHRVTITSISDTGVGVKLPYRKANLNHLKGMHACALATLCEYACGIGLMTKLDPKEYRIILKEIKLDYHTQAKTDVFAHFNMESSMLESTILEPLNRLGVLVQSFEVKTYDLNQKLICRGYITWQLKNWNKVKVHKKTSH